MSDIPLAVGPQDVSDLIARLNALTNQVNALVAAQGGGGGGGSFVEVESGASAKMSDFPDADNSGPLTGVGLQGGENVKFPMGTQLLANAEISSPVDFIELAIPSGYYAFTFLIGDVQFDAFADNLAYQVSFNGGSSYADDSSYKTQNTQSQGNTVSGSLSTDIMGFLSGSGFGGPTGSMGSAAECIIYPGTGAISPYVKGDSIDATGGAFYWFQTTSVYTGAQGRINKIKIGPFFGDGAKFVSGSYSLWGIPDAS